MDSLRVSFVLEGIAWKFLGVPLGTPRGFARDSMGFARGSIRLLRDSLAPPHDSAGNYEPIGPREPLVNPYPGEALRNHEGILWHPEQNPVESLADP